MLITYILNFIITLQFVSAVYSYSAIKDSSSTIDDVDHAKKLSLTTLVIITILFLAINSLYYVGFIDLRRLVFNLFLLSIVGSIFIFLVFYYLDNERTSHPDHNEARDNLTNKSITRNENPMQLNLTIGIISIIVTSVVFSFFIGYYFYGRNKIIKVKQPVFNNHKLTPKRDIKLSDKFII